MIEFSKQISDKWNITTALSELICEAFEKGDTPYYLSEYKPEIAIELPISTLWEIYDFLQGIEELSTKKKRLLSALKKADKLTQAVERRVNLTTSSFDLDDLMISLRPNPRSKGQLASKKDWIVWLISFRNKRRKLLLLKNSPHLISKRSFT